MTIQFVDFPIKNGGSFHSYVKLPEGKPPFSYGFPMVFPLKPPFRCMTPVRSHHWIPLAFSPFSADLNCT